MVKIKDFPLASKQIGGGVDMCHPLSLGAGGNDSREIEIYLTMIIKGKE